MMLLLPKSNHAAIVHPSKVIHQQEKDTYSPKKEKPRKKFRRWIKNHAGFLLFGGFFTAGLTMFILGLFYKIKWLWITGLLTIIAPWVLAIIIVLFAFVFRPHPKPPLPLEEPIPKKEKSSK